MMLSPFARRREKGVLEHFEIEACRHLVQDAGSGLIRTNFVKQTKENKHGRTVESQA
jgi:hypothetical protein